jgi:hypothetical protein
VSHVRDFDKWLGSLGVTLSKAFVTRNGREASHAFTYKTRNDLSVTEVSNIPRQRKRFDEHPEDVFALVKGRMHMTKTQPPVLALPHCLLSRVHAAQPPDLKAARDMPDARRKELTKLADILDSQRADRYPRAAKCIRETLEGQGAAEQPPDLKWLSSGSRARQPVATTSNKYYEHLPDTSWRLLASFCRGPAPGPAPAPVPVPAPAA